LIVHSINQNSRHLLLNAPKVSQFGSGLAFGILYCKCLITLSSLHIQLLTWSNSLIRKKKKASFWGYSLELMEEQNNKVWNDTIESAQTICDRASTLLNSWKNAQAIRSQNHRQSADRDEMSWRKPSTGRYKCNVDASFSKSLNKVGLGMCIRDDEGRYVLAKTEWITLVLDVDMGEALGMLSALQWDREL
jgi:hypothetical protein